MKIENIWNRDSTTAIFTRAYLECALRSSMDENYSIDNFAPETLQSAIDDCLRFIKLYGRHINYVHYEQAGHDLWLTRCGHGSGFWDREEVYGVKGADALAGVCGYGKEFDNIDLYISDDGLIYS